MSLRIEKSADRSGYVMRGECTVARPLEEVYAFFSAATQIEVITPP